MTGCHLWEAKARATVADRQVQGSTGEESSALAARSVISVLDG